MVLPFSLSLETESSSMCRINCYVFVVLILLFVISSCGGVEVADFVSHPTTVKARENNTVLLPCYLNTLSNGERLSVINLIFCTEQVLKGWFSCINIRDEFTFLKMTRISNSSNWHKKNAWKPPENLIEKFSITINNLTTGALIYPTIYFRIDLLGSWQCKVKEYKIIYHSFQQVSNFR